jgi:hypothetical protein
MSSSSSITHAPPRIPVPKTRIPGYHPPSTITIRPNNVTSIVIPNHQTSKYKS